MLATDQPHRAEHQPYGRDRLPDPEEEHPLDEPRFVRSHARFESSLERYHAPFESTLERRHASFEMSLERYHTPFEMTLERCHAPLEMTPERCHAPLEMTPEPPELGIEPSEVQLVELSQLGSVRRVHLVEPVNELVGDVITELVVELLGQCPSPASRAPRSSGDKIRVRSATVVCNLLRG